jgi:hypothetical protein
VGQGTKEEAKGVAMRLRTLTKIILIVVGVGLALYDVIPFMNPEKGDTISEVIAYYALRSLFLPMLFGVLAGHFFVPRDGADQKPLVLVGIALALLAYDTIAAVYNVPFMQMSQTHPICPFLIGIPVGALLWPQGREDKT